MTDLVLTGANVVDPRDGSIAWAMDVTISDGLVTSVDAASDDAGRDRAGRDGADSDGADSDGAGSWAPTATRRIDATGRFIVPGFTDMHAHALNAKNPSGALDLMLAYGITGFRQMSGSDALLTARRTGTLPISDGRPQLVELPGEVLSPGNGATVDQAVVTLHRQVAAGADFIKVAAVGPAVFTALQKVARAAGTTISGHLPAASDPVTVTHDGMRSIEHLGPGISMLAACSSDEAAIRTTLAATPELKLPPIRIPFMNRIIGALMARIVVNPIQLSSSDSIVLLQHAIDTFDESRARALAQEFSANGTWNTPTLIRQLTTQQCDLPRFAADPDNRYVAPATLKLWRSTRDKFVAKFSATDRATLRAEYELQLRLLRIFDEAGVGLLAGTDATGGVWLVPGPSLHHEFDELGRAGLSPLRVLQSATSSAAEFLGTTSSRGSVEAGKIADLVILEANPLKSVDALHAINGVVIVGRYRSAADLDALKAGVASVRSIT